MQDKRLYGIRGAVCTENTAENMQKAVADLMGRIFEKNALREDDIVSVQFTLTGDLDCANPASVLRKSGLCTGVPLFCAAEPAVKGALAHTVRVLVIAYSGSKPVHVYLGEAQKLRPDLRSS